ncbi:FecR family protein [Pedobacter sp. MC2016-24]|uniref:FecR family protein n=1 Tax=Pedobacter sp. MC2016-24 TaxID=2780090 RepID=UPI0018810310|nr:FecR domain-containing protein [Pedobacter sp. MC2016-24]MBE9601564.1 FecR domain-containing protein [Pedobacter sp. MC2016-24]
MNNLNLPDYSRFEAIDFFNDEIFIKYALHVEADQQAYWHQVLGKYPEKESALMEAETWVRILNAQKIHKPITNSEDAWISITSRIAENDLSRTNSNSQFKRIAIWLSGIAALFFIYFVAVEFLELGRKTFQSRYGELRRLSFPDESIAILNANSKVHYFRGWSSDKPRELWLEGEASFKVKHVAIKNRFQEADSFKVHVNGIRLTVLGTQFNVKDRRGETLISLIEGSLRVDKEEAGGFSRIMKPGEVFRYDGKELHEMVSEKTAKASQDWTHRELELDGYTLQDIIHVLEDNYGYHVQMNASELANKKLSGTIPLSSDADILFVMRKVFDINIIKNKNQLTINHKTKK